MTVSLLGLIPRKDGFFAAGVCNVAFGIYPLDSVALAVGSTVDDYVITSPSCGTNAHVGQNRVEHADFTFAMYSKQTKQIVFDAVTANLIESAEMLQSENYTSLDVRVDECQDEACTKMCHPLCGGNFDTTVLGLHCARSLVCHLLDS